MNEDRQENRARPELQDDSSRDIFDERCFTAGTFQHAKASNACQLARTYLTGDGIDAAFSVIEHQIMIAECAEAVDHLIRRTKGK